MKEVRDYLRGEQDIASADPASPEYQVYTTLAKLAQSCNSVDEFIAQANNVPIEGPSEEVKEAHQWLQIAIDSIQGN